MASDAQNFARATKRWESLHEKERYSVSPARGLTAILYSLESFTSAVYASRLSDWQQIEYFKNEAYEIADRTERNGGSAHVFNGISTDSMGCVLQDEMYSDIIVIGHGCLSSVIGDEREHNDKSNLDWRDVSKLATHLKLGKFVQRFCAGVDRNLPVPLGTFSVASHANVIAPWPGSAFSPELYGATEEAKLCALTSSSHMSFDEVKSLRPEFKNNT